MGAFEAEKYSFTVENALVGPPFASVAFNRQ